MREGQFEHNSIEPEKLPNYVDQAKEEVADSVDLSNTQEYDNSYWQNILKRSKEFARDALIKSAAVGLLLQFSSFEHNKVYAQRLTNASHNVELSKRPERYPKRDIEDVRNELFTDKGERFFISIPEAGDSLFEIGSGRQSSAYIDYRVIDKALSELPTNAQEFIFTHNHPQIAYKPLFDELEYSQEEFDLLFKGDHPPEHPPSMADFTAQYDMQKVFGNAEVTRNGKKNNEGLKITGQVIDFSNNWHYTVDKNNSLMENLAAANKEIDQELQPLLTPEAKRLIATVLSDASVDIRNLPQVMSKYDQAHDPNGKIKRLGESYVAIQARVTEKYKTTIDAYAQISDAGVAIMQAKTLNDREQLIKQYMELCAANGIRVTRERIKK